MGDLGTDGLGAGANGQRGERFEEVAEHRTIVGDHDAALVTAQQVNLRASEKPNRQSWVGDVMLRRGGEAGEVVAARQPGVERIEDAQLSEQLGVLGGGGFRRLVVDPGRREAFAELAHCFGVIGPCFSNRSSVVTSVAPNPKCEATFEWTNTVDAPSCRFE